MKRVLRIAAAVVIPLLGVTVLSASPASAGIDTSWDYVIVVK